MKDEGVLYREKGAALVTGATGLLGSHLLYALLVGGYRVYALKRAGSCLEAVRKVFDACPHGGELWGRIVWIGGDVTDAASLRPCMEKVALVFHCAAVVSFAAEDRERLMETNLKGTENVAALCLEYGLRCCMVSSIAALGDPAFDGERVDEDTPVIPGRSHSAYSQSKGEAERIVWKYIGKGLEAVIVCPSVILGGGHWNRSSARLYLKASRGIPVYTSGGSGYVDVRDVAAVMVRLAGDLKVSGRRFVLNGGNHSFRHLFALIAKVNGRRPPFLYMPPWSTSLAWRFCALAARMRGTVPEFTREMARISQSRSYYSSSRILTLYPDFHFHTLEETVDEIFRMRQLDPD